MNVLYDAFTGTGTAWSSALTKVDVVGTSTTITFGNFGAIQKTAGATGALSINFYNGDTAIGDGEVFTYCQAQSSTNFGQILAGRFNGTSTSYFVTVSTGGVVGKMAIYKVVGGTVTALLSLVSSVTAYPFFVKFQCIGTTIRSKIWTGSTEPAWGGSDTLSTTDSSITAAGRWGVGAYDASTATTGYTVTVEDLYIDNFVPAERPKPQLIPLLVR